MAYIQKDRVKETTTTTGTGPLTLAGAVVGFQAFSAVMSVADTCYYVIVSATGTAWETGTGTYSAASVLTRTTVLSSSNSGNAVSFGSGTKDVFMGPIAGSVNDITHGGTGAITAAAARTNLGLVIGTDVLAPTGSAASLTNFPTLNQNTTGNAATVTTNANLTGHITSTGNAAVLGSFTSAQLATALSDETGTGASVFATSPTLVTPLSNTLSAIPVTGTSVGNALAVSAGNASTTGVGGNLTLTAGSGAGVGAGGNIILRPGVQGSSGGNGILELRNGTVAQVFRAYNTYTDAANWERLNISWSSNICTIGLEKGGTGTNRTMRIDMGGNPNTEGNYIESVATNNINLFSAGVKTFWVSNGGSAGFFSYYYNGTVVPIYFGQNFSGNPNRVSDSWVLRAYGGTGNTAPTYIGFGAAYSVASGSAAHVQEDCFLVKLLASATPIVAFGSSFASTVPAIKRSGTQLQVRLADDSADASLAASYIKTTVFLVATLTAAATAGAGARAFVSDSNATTFAAVVAGGGANGVPVYSDGTNWRIG